MIYWRRGVWIILLLFLATGGAGCTFFVAAGAGAAAGIGTAEYIGGELKQAYAAPMERTWDASIAAADELKVKTTEKSIDNLDQNRVIKGKTEDGKDLQISLEKLGKDVTMVKVRIGLFGDEKRSKAVHEQIARKLAQ